MIPIIIKMIATSGGNASWTSVRGLSCDGSDGIMIFQMIGLWFDFGFRLARGVVGIAFFQIVYESDETELTRFVSRWHFSLNPAVDLTKRPRPE
jgi:hypothetical protein